MKNITIILAVMLSGCVMTTHNDWGNIEKIKSINSNHDVSVNIVFDHESYLHLFENINDVEHFVQSQSKLAKDQFNKTKLFKYVDIENDKKDYTIKFKYNREAYIDSNQNLVCTLGSIITGGTFMIVPSFCEYPDSGIRTVEVINNKTNQMKSFIYKNNVTMGIGLPTILLVPFYWNDMRNLLSHAEYQDIAFKTYEMIKTF